MFDTEVPDHESAVLAAASALVAKLDAFIDDPSYRSMFVIAAIHGVQYTGPNFSDELKALKNVLAEMDM